MANGMEKKRNRVTQNTQSNTSKVAVSTAKLLPTFQKSPFLRDHLLWRWNHYAPPKRQATQCNDIQDLNLHQHRCDTPKSGCPPGLVGKIDTQQT